MTNAALAVMTIGLLHVLVATLKHRYESVGRVVDGVPLVLLDHGKILRENMDKLRVHETDIMAAARSNGLERLEQIKYAILERNGEISIIKSESEDNNTGRE